MLYFSYGSNMSSSRLLNRIPAQKLGIALLHRHALRFHKRGRDNSAKCDAFETGAADDCVVGVIFEIDPADKPVLDRYEGLETGYAVKQVVLDLEESEIGAFTYCATLIDPTLRPFHWYKEHVLRGARENRLPPDYIRGIEAVESITDADAARHHRELLIYR